MSQFHKLLQNECLKLIIQTYQMKNKELKMKLWQLQEEISKVSLPVSDDLSNDFESIFLETDQRKNSPFMRLFWEEQQKYLQSSENNATCHPVNIVTYRTVNLFSSDKCFIYFIPDVPHNIWWNRQNTVYKILLKVDILDTCRAIITFLLFFTIVENVVHTSCQNSMLLFINALIFYIMNIQNNQSHEFEWNPMPAPLRSVNDWRYSWLCNVFLKSLQDWLNSVQQRYQNFTTKKYWPENVYIMTNIWKIENKR